MLVRRFLPHALAFGLAVLAAGCTSPTAVLDVATSPAEDRSMSQLGDDASIKIDLNGKLLAERYRDLFLDVNTNVYEGNVLLTGTVKSEKDMENAPDNSEIQRQEGIARGMVAKAEALETSNPAPLFHS